MNKRKAKLITICILCIILIIILTIICSNKLDLIENIKNKIYKLTNNSMQVSKGEITTIDITGLVPAPESQHEHIYKTHYDDTKHWEECIVCQIRRNEQMHSIITNWALGVENCRPGNLYTKTCNCGYTKKGHKPCVWDGKSYSSYNGLNNTHRKVCSMPDSGNGISYLYYLEKYGQGDLYIIQDVEVAPNPNEDKSTEQCELSNGTKITCENGGTCAKCGRVAEKGSHKLEVRTDKGIYCKYCNKKYGTYSETIVEDGNYPKTYNITWDISFMNGAIFNKVYDNQFKESFYNTKECNLLELNQSKTQAKIQGKIKFINTKKNYSRVSFYIITKINNVNSLLRIDKEDILPDCIKPAISDDVQIEEIENWKKSKRITISGTENWSNIVNIKIESDRNETIYSGDVNVVDNKWSLSCIPELEADENGRIFTVTATDESENSITNTVDIMKVDCKPPTVISSDNIGGTEWVKERVFTFTAEDLGVGNVQIGFNNVNDYSLAVRDGTDYSKEYKFVGDAYSPVQGSVYFKDELGNITTQVVTIDKVDNTAPTITKGSIHNNVLTLESHDRHSTLGEGSGVIKYRYIASKEKLENPEVSGEKSIEVNIGDKIVIENISQVKYIYVVAEDLVGNISESYEIKVPELVLTSRVDTSVSEGKGGVILDWAGYETLDKYFVIYRKEEGTEEFEVIKNNFSGNTYIDTTANDKTKSSIPEINIEKDIENNEIKMTPSSEDAGTKYTYYIEAYDINTRKLIAKSNIK